jgi:3'(2'), 5'-bisphosphate nucleotidase
VSLAAAVAIADRAAQILIDHYRSDLAVVRKADGSPVTDADRASSDFLTRELGALGGLPVISEESPIPPLEERRGWARYWLIDPLDGTRDFIAHTGEFAINVALIEGDRPVLGVIVAPALGVAWWAQRGGGAFARREGKVAPIRCRAEGPPWIGLKSRFHATPKTDRFFAEHGVGDVREMGSTIKVCLVAEGEADVYMSPGRSMEWDTAPGQIVVEEAGGHLLALPSLEPLRYNRADPTNPALVVCSQRFFEQRLRLTPR